MPQQRMQAQSRCDHLLPDTQIVAFLSPAYWAFAGAPGSTSPTPSGLMLKAKKVNGSLAGFPHWCTRSNCSEIKEPGPLSSALPSTVFAPVPEMTKYNAAPDDGAVGWRASAVEM